MATTRKTTGKRSTKKPVTASKARSARATTKTTKKTAKPTTKKTVKAEVKTTVAQKNKSQTSSGLEKLRDWNIAAAMINIAQAVAVVLLANDRTFPVTTTHATTNSLASLENEEVLVVASRNLLDVRIAYLLAGVLGLSALVHLILAFWRRKQYELQLAQRQNSLRWVGSAVILGGVAAISAMAAGFSDKTTLALLFIASVVTAWSFMLTEKQNQNATRDWSNFIVGSLSGAAVWLALGWFVFASMRYGEVTLPGFVLVLLGSMLVLFAATAYVLHLSVKRTGRWSEYLNVEKAFMLLSLITTSALTWQIFAGFLR